MSEKDPIATARDILEAEIKAKKKEVLEVEDTEEEEEVEEAKAKTTTEGDCEGDDCDEVDEDTDEDEDEVEESATAHAADGPQTAPKSAEGKGTEIKTDEGPDNSKKNKKSTDSKPSTTGDVTKAKMKESIGSLFDNEDLSEEFKTKAETVFEAAVHMRIDEINTALVEEFETKLTETKEELSTSVTERLNDYLAYVVEEWMKENEIALERGVRDDIAEDFLSGLRNLFLENNIDIPETNTLPVLIRSKSNSIHNSKAMLFSPKKSVVTNVLKFSAKYVMDS
jgi:hypothetical protein